MSSEITSVVDMKEPTDDYDDFHTSSGDGENGGPNNNSYYAPLGTSNFFSDAYNHRASKSFTVLGLVFCGFLVAIILIIRRRRRGLAMQERSRFAQVQLQDLTHGTNQEDDLEIM